VVTTFNIYVTGGALFHYSDQRSCQMTKKQCLLETATLLVDRLNTDETITTRSNITKRFITRKPITT